VGLDGLGVPLGHQLHRPPPFGRVGQLGLLLPGELLGVGDHPVRAGQGGRHRLPGHQ
jgi:hypothetical protein